jgi:hypothetical protein
MIRDSHWWQVPLTSWQETLYHGILWMTLRTLSIRTPPSKRLSNTFLGMNQGQINLDCRIPLGLWLQDRAFTRKTLTQGPQVSPITATAQQITSHTRDRSSTTPQLAPCPTSTPFKWRMPHSISTQNQSQTSRSSRCSRIQQPKTWLHSSIRQWWPVATHRSRRGLSSTKLRINRPERNRISLGWSESSTLFNRTKRWWYLVGLVPWPLPRPKVHSKRVQSRRTNLKLVSKPKNLSSIPYTLRISPLMMPRTSLPSIWTRSTTSNQSVTSYFSSRQARNRRISWKWPKSTPWSPYMVATWAIMLAILLARHSCVIATKPK